MGVVIGCHAHQKAEPVPPLRMTGFVSVAMLLLVASRGKTADVMGHGGGPVSSWLCSGTGVWSCTDLNQRSDRNMLEGFPRESGGSKLEVCWSFALRGDQLLADVHKGQCPSPGPESAVYVGFLKP